MLPPMKRWRDADGHLGELAPVEVSVDVEDVGPVGFAALPEMVGAVEDLPSAVRAALDLGEAGGLSVGACAEGRIDDKFGRRGLFAVERSDPVFFGYSLRVVRPSVSGVHHPEIAGDPELVFPARLGLFERIRIGRDRSVLAELPQIRHIRRLGRVGGTIERAPVAASCDYIVSRGVGDIPHPVSRCV